MVKALSILHLDMDAFYAAVEQRDNPLLRGRPVLIGHDGPRGVVATASYEARVFGCHSAQPMSVAKRLCPDAVIVATRAQRYAEVSARIFRILADFSPVIEPLSIDEAFLDLGGTQLLQGDGFSVAGRIRDRIKSELGLTASAGVAANKFLAKLASDMDKPDGLTVIAPDDVDRVLLPLPVTRLWGVGQATAEKLARVGIRTIGDLRLKDVNWLKRYLGRDAHRYHELARGIDHRPVVPDREAKSISHERTFGSDLADAGQVRCVLLDQVEQVAARLRAAGMRTRSVSLKIRYGDFQTITRSLTLDVATDATNTLWHAAAGLFDKWLFQPVRLIGFGADSLQTGAGQLLLFSDPEDGRNRKLDAVTDSINAKFGKRTISRGTAADSS